MCGNYLFIIYHVAHQIFSFYILVNLFVLVIIDEFEKISNDPDSILIKYPDMMAEFKLLWCSRTIPYEGEKILKSDIMRFYLDLNQPLGFGNSSLLNK